MHKKHSLKFWLFFWLLSVVFLSGWFLYWSFHFRGLFETSKDVLNVMPMSAEQKKDYLALAAIGEEFLLPNNQEKNLLVLFQNNLELRPGGGFVGAFAVVKIQNGKIVSFKTEDLSNFDNNIPNVLKAPYPIPQVMGTDFWKMRDSNFSPDFQTDALAAQEFYKLGGGTEKIDGVIGITSDVLTSMLKITGPISLEGYPGTYDSNNAIIALEYQVEKAFGQQGIARDDRKSIMSDLALEIKRRILQISFMQKIELVKIIFRDFADKNIQVEFNDPKVQVAARAADWTGNVDQNWNKDYLMAVDANLGSFKSDYYVKRSLSYEVDLSEVPARAHLTIIYQHTAGQKDWMTKDYLTYLRLYVPQGSELLETQNFDNVQAGQEFGKQYFGALVKVPLSTTKTVELKYALPPNISAEQYALEIQKQAGLENIPMDVKIINKNGKVKEIKTVLNSDLKLK